MIKEIINLDTCNADTLSKSEMAFLILSDLSTTYSFMGEHPTKKEADKLAYEAKRILGYINIACEYVSNVKQDLKQASVNIDNLLDMAKVDNLSMNRSFKVAEPKASSFNLTTEEFTRTNDDFMQYVYERVEKALKENGEYMELQYKYVEAQNNNNNELANEIKNTMEARAEELCYIRGFNDAMQHIINSN